jgi:hypothetical protein
MVVRNFLVFCSQKPSRCSRCCFYKYKSSDEATRPNLWMLLLEPVVNFAVLLLKPWEGEVRQKTAWKGEWQTMMNIRTYQYGRGKISSVVSLRFNAPAELIGDSSACII